MTESRKLECSRQLRCESINSLRVDKEKTSGVLRLEDGIYHRGGTIVIEGSSIKIQCQTGEKGNNGVYVDDIMALCRDILKTKPKHDIQEMKALGLLQEAINCMDRRAEEIHGFSHSEEERNYVPPYKKDK